MYALKFNIFWLWSRLIWIFLSLMGFSFSSLINDVLCITNTLFSDFDLDMIFFFTLIWSSLLLQDVVLFCFGLIWFSFFLFLLSNSCSFACMHWKNHDVFSLGKGIKSCVKFVFFYDAFLQLGFRHVSLCEWFNELFLSYVDSQGFSQEYFDELFLACIIVIYL